MTEASKNRALVVLSGGQDSTTCLYWALKRYGDGNVGAVTFDYGQRHRIELGCAAEIAESAGVPHVQLPIDTFAALGGDALTDDIDRLLEGKSGASPADMGQFGVELFERGNKMLLFHSGSVACPAAGSKGLCDWPSNRSTARSAYASGVPSRHDRRS